MTTHSSIFTWRIPQTEEPGGLQSTGITRVRQDQATNTAFYTKRGGSRVLLPVLTEGAVFTSAFQQPVTGQSAGKDVF